MRSRDVEPDKTKAECDSQLKNRVALQWKTDKPLTFSTYGGTAKATFRGLVSYTDTVDDDGLPYKKAKPQIAFAVTVPSCKPVTVSNIAFDRWETSAVHLYNTKNVTIENCAISRIGTKFFTSSSGYSAGVIYPKRCSYITIRGNSIKNCVNKSAIGAQHAVYVQRASFITIENNVIEDQAGPPLKFDESTHDIVARGNTLRRCALTTKWTGEQRGFVRIPGNPTENQTYNVLVENNSFLKPYCIPQPGKTDCAGEVGDKYTGAFFTDHPDWDSGGENRNVVFKNNVWDVKI